MIRRFERINLRKLNSFRVAQQADALVEFETADDLQEIFAAGEPPRWMVLAGGNNILFTRDYDGLLLTPVGRRIERLSDDGTEVVLRVEAGLEWDELVAATVAEGLWGLENLSLIPGRVGAAPVQNIGAYGCEAKDTIERVRCYDVAAACERVFEREECRFGYRESIFKHELKGRVIITAVEFRLSRRPAPKLSYGAVAQEVEARGGTTLQNIREAVCAIRRSKLPDPAELGNAGSFFKNPVVDRAVADALLTRYPTMPHYATDDPARVKLAAGWLIEQAGLKGYAEGAVGVHDRQALVLVNRGGATGAEVIAFARKVQARVAERFGVSIDTEVNIW